MMYLTVPGTRHNSTLTICHPVNHSGINWNLHFVAILHYCRISVNCLTLIVIVKTSISTIKLYGK